MPVRPSPTPLPLYVPASLATEPVGPFLAGSLASGNPGPHVQPIGYVLVRVLGTAGPHEGRSFAAEAVYDRPTSYGHAVADLHTARRADGGPYRRILTVWSDGIID